MYAQPLTHPRRHWYKSKLPIVVACSTAALIAYVVAQAYGYWENYRDRPLGPNFAYVGRDYRSGCTWVVLCASAAHNDLYYATDVEADLINQEFPGWSATPTKHPMQYYGLAFDSEMRDSTSKVACKGMFRPKNDNEEYDASICYVKSADEAYREFNLRPIHKKYLIVINNSLYDDPSYGLAHKA